MVLIVCLQIFLDKAVSVLLIERSYAIYESMVVTGRTETLKQEKAIQRPKAINFAKYSNREELPSGHVVFRPLRREGDQQKLPETVQDLACLPVVGGQNFPSGRV